MTTCSYNRDMKAVGIRELKARLSAYIRMVREGEDVLVTDRGVVVAEIRPPRPLAAEDPTQRGLDELERRGLMRRGSGADAGDDDLPRFEAVGPDGTSRRLLDQERGS